MRHALLLCCLLGGLRAMGHTGAPITITVPYTLTFCGMELRLTEAARDKVQGYVDQLTRNPTYYQSLVQKGATFLPHVADAFRHMGTPEDLIYICIQESGLQGDAVSSSNAVGFWQFKEPTAKAMGLVVDDTLDERKHLTRASLAAARYLRQNYDRTGNWFYAVVAYMTGPTGALPYIEERYRGAQRMVITENDHWYALKVLAHVLAFANAIAATTPTVWLEPQSVAGEQSLWRVLEATKVTRSLWAPYNLWATTMRLPKARPMTHFMPRWGTPVAHRPDPHLSLFTPPKPWSQPAPSLAATDEPTAPDTTATRPAEPTPQQPPTAAPSLLTEPTHGVFYAFLPQQTTLAEFARASGYARKELQKFNPTLDGGLHPAGTRILLVPPKQVPVHIVLPGETLDGIAALYRLPATDLAQRNRLDPVRPGLVPGQKLYLRQARPPGEPTVVYALPGQ